MSDKKNQPKDNNPLELLSGESDRRSFIKGLSFAAAAGSAALTTGCIPSAEGASSEELKLRWQEFFKENYRLMTQKDCKIRTFGQATKGA